jgi:hypothetical protein
MTKIWNIKDLRCETVIDNGCNVPNIIPMHGNRLISWSMGYDECNIKIWDIKNNTNHPVPLCYPVIENGNQMQRSQNKKLKMFTERSITGKSISIDGSTPIIKIFVVEKNCDPESEHEFDQFCPIASEIMLDENVCSNTQFLILPDLRIIGLSRISNSLRIWDSLGHNNMVLQKNMQIIRRCILWMMGDGRIVSFTEKKQVGRDGEIKIWH